DVAEARDARIIDRARLLENRLEAGGVEESRAGKMYAELRQLRRRGWLVNVIVEHGISDPEMLETFAEELEDAGAEGGPDDYGVMTYVSLEPSGAPKDGVDLMMAVLEMLAKTCDGVVLAN
ncbi:MAG: hypothetical protein B7Z38_06870, partial [Rhodobacterales bacterium 12-64-8]